ncbi:molybdopterin-dependent oxidoreductase [Actinoallomurus sp. CA-142502]|uniref:molybdopterin-dependent oxidoreductase n=1 Tax=Actinoallomurus sp. CA-142502 TaxID=3239885 RepID=UPI003D8F151C
MSSVSSEGSPVGRRVVLGMVGLGALGVATGAWVQRGVNRALGPVGSGISGIVPAAGGFRFYTVTGPVKRIAPADYNLRVRGLVERPRSYSFADLQHALPQTRMTDTFHCVTGWNVPNVAWEGVALPDLLDAVGVRPGARGVRFTSFDGTYTESLTMEQARRRDVIVATGMLGGPVSHDHGGPVRMYVAPMYGYKSTKWLSGIEVVGDVRPGYWEERGYDVDAWVGRSNGYTS